MMCGAKALTLMLAMLACMAMTSCSSDDDDEAASEIVGTWIMDDDVSITFNDNNTGYVIVPVDDDDDYAFAKSLTRAAQTQTINFTYNYNATAHTLTMTANSETETWTGVSVADGVLYATDSDGDRITAVKQDSDTVDVTGDIDISKLYGTWINGLTTYYFTESNLTIKGYDDGEHKLYTETRTYTYDKSSHALIFSGEVGTLTVTALTDSRLSLRGYTLDDIPNQTFTFARKGLEVGNISLLYDKTWKLSADAMWLTFKSNGTGTISSYDEEDGKFSYPSTWDYDSKTKTITISVDKKYVMSLVLTGLASDVFICKFIGTDGDSSESDNTVFYAD